MPSSGALTPLASNHSLVPTSSASASVPGSAASQPTTASPAHRIQLASAVTRPPTTAASGQPTGRTGVRSVRRCPPWVTVARSGGPLRLRRGVVVEAMAPPCSPSDCARMGGTRHPRVKSWVVVGVRTRRMPECAIQPWRLSQPARSSSTWSTRRPQATGPGAPSCEPDPEPEPPQLPPGPSAGPNGSTPSSYLEEDTPKPLYRDEVSDAPGADLRTAVRSGRAPGYADLVAPPRTPLSRQINFAPRRPPRGEEEATTILPRPHSGGRMPRWPAG